VCGRPNLFLHNDHPVPSALGPLPSVVERTNNTTISHGLLEFLLFDNGSLITIQNLTWNRFQESQEQNFFVSYHQSLGCILEIANAAISNTPQIDTAGGGYQGVMYTKRGLTFVTVALAGHEIPLYVPGAAYHQLEFLQGRIDSLEQMGDYTTQTSNFTGVLARLKRRI
jgi:carboxypeptidase D